MSEYVEVITGQGYKQAKALESQDGLALTEFVPEGTEEKYYTITHLKSGRCFAGGETDYDIALKFYREMLKLGCWERTERQLRRFGTLYSKVYALKEQTGFKDKMINGEK